MNAIKTTTNELNEDIKTNQKDNMIKPKITLPFVEGINVLKRKLEKLNIKVETATDFIISKSNRCVLVPN